MDVLLIGIDAGCLPVLRRLFDEGKLSSLESVFADGAVGPLTSQVPPWTPSAWPSMYTGVNPGKHGVFGFVGYDGYDWHVVSSDHVREYALWELLDQRGYSSVVVNAPVTHPPAEIDGAILPGFIGPEDPTCHPEGLLDDVRDAIGEYRVYEAYKKENGEHSVEKRREEYCNLVRMRGEAFDYLADRFDPDFGFVQFQKPDTVFHEFGGDDWETVTQVYETMDEQVGAILDAHDPDTVFVASDHGIKSLGGHRVFVNDFLKDRGYTETVTGGKGMPSWRPIKNDLQEGRDEDEWEPGTIERLAAMAARAGFTADKGKKVLDRVGLVDVAKQYLPTEVARTATEQVSFAESTAYVRARAECGVRVNLAGRDPEGTVPPDEYETVRESLIDDLAALETPDGDPVFETVAKREEFFDGPYVGDAVDVVTVPTEMDHFLSAELRGETFSEAENVWDHQFDGVVAAAGEGVDADASLEDAHLFDVAPTILTAMGVPYSDRMDGSVLPVVKGGEAASYPEYDPDETSDRATAGDDVQERLADLGYVE